MCSWTAVERRTQALQSQDQVHTLHIAVWEDYGFQEVPAPWWMHNQGICTRLPELPGMDVQEGILAMGNQSYT